jgi:hypothetical protein
MWNSFFNTWIRVLLELDFAKKDEEGDVIIKEDHMH